jgi:regulator of sirC expression with transglutaminase-like and TPR domain
VTGAPASERFAELVALPEEQIPLDETALLIAAHARPSLDVAAELRRLDRLADSCPEETFEGLCAHLFGTLGFAGNTENYGEPANSYLDRVLARRVGIPISLAVVAIEIGRRIGVPLVGIGMPGHFLAGHAEPDGEMVYLDAFGGGVCLSAEGCEALFRRLGGSGPFHPRFLDPVGPRAILSRMLANLQALFLLNDGLRPGPASDLRAAAWVLGLRLRIPGLPPGERRQMARGLASLGQWNAAGAELERLAEELPAEAAEKLRTEAKGFRARSN